MRRYRELLEADGGAGEDEGLSDVVAGELARIRREYPRPDELFTRDTVGKILDVPSPMTRSLFERIGGPDGARARPLKLLGFPFDPEENSRCFSFLFDHAYIDTSAGFRALTAGLPVDLDASRVGLAPSTEIRDLPKRITLGRMTARDWLRLPAVCVSIALIPWKGFRRATWMRRGYDDVVRPDLFAWIEARREEDLRSLAAGSLAASIEEGVERIQSIYAEHQLGDIFSIFPIKMIERLVRLAGGDPFPFFESTRAEVESIYRRQSEIDLLRYAEGEIPLETILRDHGWRGSPEWEFAEPRWREAPATLLAEEVARIRAHYGVRGAKELKTSERMIAEAREMLFGLLTRAVARTGAFQWLIRRFFRDFILWAEIKERAWYDCVRVVDVLRARMLEIGRRTGLGERVFFATLAEVGPLCAGRSLSETIDARARRVRLSATLPLPTTCTRAQLEAEVARILRERAAPS